MDLFSFKLFSLYKNVYSISNLCNIVFIRDSIIKICEHEISFFPVLIFNITFFP
jgi:hypothetical protein